MQKYLAKPKKNQMNLAVIRTYLAYLVTKEYNNIDMLEYHEILGQMSQIPGFGRLPALEAAEWDLVV